MKTKKLLSLILAVIMIMSVLPMYASAAEKLTATANVESYPTISYKNADGKMYYGQTLEEALIINDDEVVRDAAGNQVAGHFEFRKPEYMPSPPGTDYKIDVIFVPDDEDAYTSFSKLKAPIYYDCQKVELVPVDANDTIPVASEVEAGSKLTSSVLSGAYYVNSYNKNEPNAAQQTWHWYNGDYEPSNMIVTESGYYKAMFYPSGYEMITEWVLVRVKGDTSEVKMSTTIEELPTVDGTVCVGDRWRDIKFIGGKAVGMNGEELSGTFLIDRDGTINSLNVGPNVKFIPDDERYASSESRLTIDVEPGPIKFVDENGDAIVPEITVPYGTKVKDLEPRLRTLSTNCNETLFYDLSANDDVSLTVGTHTLEVVVRPSKTVGVTPNYLDTTLTFKVVVEPKTVPMRLSGSVDEKNTLIITTVNSNDPKPQGTYDVYVDGELYAEKVPGKFTWAPEKSGEYNFRVVYNPIENDPCLVEEFTYQRNEKLERLVNRINTTNQGGLYVTYGTEVTLTSNVLAENFGGWRITDANGNEVDLGVDTSGVKITFTMPDFNITVEAIDKSQSSTGGDAGDGTDGGIFGGIWSFFQKLINWFISIIKQMMSLFGLGA